MKLSIIIPCYNEKKTIEKVVKNILSFCDFNKEIIIVDDGSTDGSVEIIKKVENETKELKAIFLNNNFGKGHALKIGLKSCSGNVVVIQDADLEYSPKDYNKLILPFSEADADVVYGSRFLGSRYSRLHYFSHYIANKILTFVCNVFTNLNMTDMQTGYKLFKRDVINTIDIKEKSFGVEPEITIKLAKKGYKFFEVPISYNGRSYAEGKKIRAKDGIIALYCIFKYKFFN